MYSNKGVEKFLWCFASMDPWVAPLALEAEMAEHQVWHSLWPLFSMFASFVTLALFPAPADSSQF